MKIYKVGGSVRDAILGLSSNDLDYVVVGSTPAQMLRFGYKQVGKDFPVFLHPETGSEYALARSERSTGAGHSQFSVDASPNVTLEQDLSRRDLTMNAIARDDEGNHIDPFGGQEDIRQGLLRHVSDDFKDDPLRVLRAARFAAQLGEHGFVVAPDTLALMRSMVDEGMLDALTPERVWKETQKALSCPAPRRYIEVLRECGALKVVFPEVDALFGVPQPEKHHPEVDTGEHILLVLEQAAILSDSPLVRFGALVHDLGKGVTPPAQWPKHIGHEEAGVPLVEALCDRYRVPNEYRDIGVLASRYHLRCHVAMDMTPKALLKTLTVTDALRKPERFEAFLQVCEADARGRLGLASAPYPQKAHLRQVLQVAREVTGRNIVIKPGMKGPAIGEALYRERMARIKRHLNADPGAAAPGAAL